MLSAVRYGNTYQLDSDLSVGYRYPPFEKLGSAAFQTRPVSVNREISFKSFSPFDSVPDKHLEVCLVFL